MIDYNISFFQHKLKEWKLKNDKDQIDLSDESEIECLNEDLAEYKMWIANPEWRDDNPARKKEIRKEGLLKFLLEMLDVANADNIDLQQLLVEHFRNTLNIKL